MVVHFQYSLCQDIESGHAPNHTGLEIGAHAMLHLLTMEDGGQPRVRYFYQHTHVPCPTLTDLHVGWVPGLGMQTGSRQDDHRVGKLGAQRLKMGLVDVGRGDAPGSDQAPLMQDHTECTADNPPMIPLAFAANRSGDAPACMGWSNAIPSLSATPYNGAAESRLCLGAAETQQPGTQGHAGRTRDSHASTSTTYRAAGRVDAVARGRRRGLLP
jgi:hypothetical protein